MLYYPDGAASYARYIRVGISLVSDIAERDDASINRFSMHREICTLILEAALEGGSADREIDCSADIFLTADFPGKQCAIQATARIDLCFDPMNFGADLERPLELSPEEALRKIIENEVDRAWGPYRLDGFVDDVRELARCLHLLTYWDGRSVLEVMQVMQQIEPLVVRHGHDVDDFVNLYKPNVSLVQPKASPHGRLYWDSPFGPDPTVPLPEGVWPANLSAENVLLFDAAGRTLVVDEWGRLALGATVAERLERNSHHPAVNDSKKEPEVVLRRNATDAAGIQSEVDHVA